MNSVLTTALLGLFVTVAAGTDPLVVTTTLGKVRGQLAKTRGGRQYTQFLGIPYAKSPTGSLRFKSPVSPDPWVSVLNATKECSDCIQQYVPIEALRTVVSGSEDCLCVNVYTPSSASPTQLPVMVFIHGGSYVGGSGSPTLYGGDLMLDQDVVLVTLNYRLGVMGFLSTGDEVIPGNFGLKDQAHALKWVKQNIENFGGDPNSITLMGESAGSASANLHQHSPLSKGLFHKAIQESGSILNPWSMVLPEVLKGRAAVLAKAMGCPSSKSADLLKCLQEAPAREIVNTTHTFLARQEQQ